MNMRKKGDVAQLKIVHTKEPNSLIPSEIPATEILINTVVSENVKKVRTDT